MPTSKEKVRAGVDAIDAAKNQEPMALAGLLTAPKSLPEIKQRVAQTQRFESLSVTFEALSLYRRA